MVRIMNQQNNYPIADIHTHILPFMDDGPQSLEESVEILKFQKAQGVTDIVFTPHFRLENESIDEFIYRRDKSFDALINEIVKDPLLSSLKFYSGAEVWYDPNIIYQDISRLCIEDTSYILIELLSSYPFNLENTMNWLISDGITPIIAHVERYPYLTDNRKLMRSLAEMGVLFQCNAASLVSNRHKRVVNSLIRQDLVHILASDVHNRSSRPPNLMLAYEKLKGKSRSFIINALDVVNDELI